MFERHPDVYPLLMANAVESLRWPRELLLDAKKPNTGHIVFKIHNSEIYFVLVVRMKHVKMCHVFVNSVTTRWGMNEKKFKKHLKKHKIVFKD